MLLTALLASAWGCSRESPAGDFGDDDSFGTDPGHPHDGGLDAALGNLDAAVPSEGGSVRVRLVQGAVNLGSLTVCHDPDGAGPRPAYVLSDGINTLRADFATRSAAVSLPTLSSGVLTLQRDAPTNTDAGLDGGVLVADAGFAIDLCDESTREATIPLPITRDWLDPHHQLTDENLAELDLPSVLGGAPAVTLLGSGVALKPQALDGVNEAAFGTRALIQADPPAGTGQSFSLAVFHAVPDVRADGDAGAAPSVGAVRLCVTAGGRETSQTPAVIPFRLRVGVGSAFDPKLSYTFRVFAKGEFDAQNKDCSTTSVMPIAKAMFSSSTFQPGHAYTLLLVGAIAPLALCGASDTSIWRAGCPRPASELEARIVLLVD